MPKWSGTFNFDIDSYDMKGGDKNLFTDGKKTYEVLFGLKGRGYQEGYYSRGTSYDRWGDPGNAPESEIEDAGVLNYDFTYCEAYELDEHGEVISEEAPYYTVFIDEAEGINLLNCGEEARDLFESLRSVDKKSRSIIDTAEMMIDEYCWEASVDDTDFE